MKLNRGFCFRVCLWHKLGFHGRVDGCAEPSVASYVEHVSDGKIRLQPLNVFLRFDSLIQEVDVMKAELTEHACFTWLSCFPTHFLLHAWAASDFNGGLTLDVGVSCDFSVYSVAAHVPEQLSAFSTARYSHRYPINSLSQRVPGWTTRMCYWWCAVLHPNSWHHDMRWPRLRLRNPSNHQVA